MDEGRAWSSLGLRCPWSGSKKANREDDHNQDEQCQPRHCASGPWHKRPSFGAWTVDRYVKSAVPASGLGLLKRHSTYGEWINDDSSSHYQFVYRSNKVLALEKYRRTKLWCCGALLSTIRQMSRFGLVLLVRSFVGRSIHKRFRLVKQKSLGNFSFLIICNK